SRLACGADSSFSVAARDWTSFAAASLGAGVSGVCACSGGAAAAQIAASKIALIRLRPITCIPKKMGPDTLPARILRAPAVTSAVRRRVGRRNDWQEAEQPVEKAQEYFHRRQWVPALDELRAAIAINPHNAAWHFNAGLILDELARFEEAAVAYRQAHSLDP